MGETVNISYLSLLAIELEKYCAWKHAVRGSWLEVNFHHIQGKAMSQQVGENIASETLNQYNTNAQ